MTGLDLDDRGARALRHLTLLRGRDHLVVFRDEVEARLLSPCGGGDFRFNLLASLRVYDNMRLMEGANPVSPLQLAGAAVYIALWPTLMFVVAGDGRWLEGWLFTAWYLALCATVIAWLYRKDPALLAERYSRPGSGGQTHRDQALVYAIVVGFAAWILVMPLDARRFGWTPSFPIGIKATGGAFLLASAFLLFRSFRDNTFLSPLVRIQTERRHRVVSTGVYGFVRHPMYLGAVSMFVGTPLLLGSVVGLGLTAAMTLLLAFRIVGEERSLAEELEGYTEYRQNVRYRLLPFVW
jgi:protein-S-isoprenylcysteine O-methyltransferase Ste14